MCGGALYVASSIMKKQHRCHPTKDGKGKGKGKKDKDEVRQWNKEAWNANWQSTPTDAPPQGAPPLSATPPTLMYWHCTASCQNKGDGTNDAAEGTTSSRLELTIMKAELAEWQRSLRSLTEGSEMHSVMLEKINVRNQEIIGAQHPAAQVRACQKFIDAKAIEIEKERVRFIFLRTQIDIYAMKSRTRARKSASQRKWTVLS